MFDTKIAKRIFEKKYAIDENEDWKKASWRIANEIKKVEEKYCISEEEALQNTAEFFDIIYNRYFLPGGRIIANIGTGIDNLYNCFFFDIEDSRESIYDTLGNAGEIFAWGGGVGIEISKLREKGALIKSTGGESSGPVSFLKLFNLTGDVIQQSSRRAAIIAIMDVSHPDIFSFIHCKSESNGYTDAILSEFKRNLNISDKDTDDKTLEILRQTLADRQLLHFNISVVITDDFMEAVENDEEWELISPSSGEVVETVQARELLDEIAEHVWINGDPGILFRDRVDQDNMVKYIEEHLGTNPCGEINLLSGEPCNLGSINLHSVVKNGRIDYEMLEYLVRKGIRFLDDVHDLSSNRVEEVNRMSEGLRRTGLGVMGFSDMLAELEIPYDSQDAKDLAEYLSWFISKFAWMESIVLANERGHFPFYDKDKADLSVVEKVFDNEKFPEGFNSEELIKQMRKQGLRNVSTTAIAPTGSISLIAEVNSSIEPFYSLAYERNVTEGENNLAKEKFIITNPIFKSKLKERGIEEETIEEIDRYILENKTVQGCELVPEDLQEVFKTAHDLPPKAHIDIQASWQRYISNAISKTINLPHDYKEEDIPNLIVDMWKKGIKSSTIYRDGSRFFQILN